MFYRLKTAFKHPGCGGVIFSYEWPERIRFKCERCGAWGDDLAEMALGQVERPRPAMPERLVEDKTEQDQVKAAVG